MDALMHEIASNAADYAVDRWGQHLSKRQRLTLWNRYYDSSLAALMTFEEVSHAQAIRARAFISEN